MKKNSFLPGLLLLFFGLYFLLQQLNISLWDGMFTWSTLLVITGAALLLQAYKQSDYPNILPGFVLLGIGLHFQLKDTVAVWPDHFAVIILILGVGFILRAQKTKGGMFEGVLLCILASFFLFYGTFMEMLGVVETGVEHLYNYWPVILIIIGAFLVVKKK
ncbi:LiaF transmembrane domain-containing protein [Sutcliffiella rhizosphaerae]|uniref:LiaF transmembrane domain-containing protein n=1 Tax=Sutcliffiella rhizosphaerae TaxID=2880967 RepID=A0ABM8YI07_9BACI|nr:DUF5668 domain-containing protein [Sutcliffiella rhizosphaerae]CAG9619530.1 hypothetical protein BACCIP111883_00297 [Sutcliffiella rhizosphaerae]